MQKVKRGSDLKIGKFHFTFLAIPSSSTIKFSQLFTFQKRMFNNCTLDIRRSRLSITL